MSINQNKKMNEFNNTQHLQQNLICESDLNKVNNQHQIIVDDYSINKQQTRKSKKRERSPSESSSSSNLRKQSIVSLSSSPPPPPSSSSSSTQITSSLSQLPTTSTLPSQSLVTQSSPPPPPPQSSSITSSITSSSSQPTTSTNAATSTATGTSSSTTTQVAQTIKKEKQRPETWNKIEQQIFFNALRQNGKNFESITQYFNTRQKRYKIDAVQRSKEQIRHFYYRTWHKIIKYVSIPKDQCIRDIQVNCLIAFNALMNKSHRWNKKSAIKLVELINLGWTTVREKGKITRLRMPICKVTKTVAPNLESNPQLPQVLSVCLHPKNELAFCKVQKLAQNPYLMIDLQSTHTIKYLIEYLENKWKDRKMQFFEKFDCERKRHRDEQFVMYIDETHEMYNLEIEPLNNFNINLRTNNNNNNNQLVVDDNSLCLNGAGVNNAGQNSGTNINSSNNDHQHQSLFQQHLNNNLNNNNNNNNNSSNTTATTILSTNEQQQSHSTTIIKIRLKSPDSSEIKSNNKQSASNKHATTSATPSTTQNNPASTQISTTDNTTNDQNPNDSHIEEDDGLLTSTEDEIDRDENVNQINTPTTKSQPQANNKKYLSKKQNSITTNQQTSVTNMHRSQINIEQLKSGLTSKCELTFIQLYLALNKPNTIKLKYEWLPLKTTDDNVTVTTSNISDLIEKQRLYIEVLSKVAESYLYEIKHIQQDNNNPTTCDSNSSANSRSNAANNSTATTVLSNSTNTNNVSSNKSENKRLVNSSTSKQQNDTQSTVSTTTSAGGVTSTSSASTSPQSIALINSTGTSLMPVESLLQKINEEQAQKTKMLLQDISLKARKSRQRKAIVVSSSRPVMPKITTLDIVLPPQTSTTPPPSQSTQQTVTTPQQNIVFSGPVAAVARQMSYQTVNSSNDDQYDYYQQQQQTTNAHFVQPLIPQQNSINDQQLQPQQLQSQSQHTLSASTQSLHQNYSNIIPQILTTLMNDSNSNSSMTQKIVNEQLQTTTISDASLMEMSLNDSVFCLNENSNMSTISNLFNSLQCKTTSDNQCIMTQPQQLQESDQQQQQQQQQQTELQDQQHQDQQIQHIMNHNSHPVQIIANKQMQMPSSTISASTSSNFKRSDTLEWNDAFNDISLASFLNEIQSPDKRNIVNTINDNSRDSLFFNMDTIIDILPNSDLTATNSNQMLINNQQQMINTNSNSSIIYKLNNQQFEIPTTTTTPTTSSNITSIANNLESSK